MDLLVNHLLLSSLAGFKKFITKKLNLIIWQDSIDGEDANFKVINTMTSDF